MNALFDTNILIDYLNGIDSAKTEIARYEQPLISLITWMEVMAGARADDTAKLRAFLRRFRCIGIDGAIAEQTVVLRQKQRIKLPDAIIRATALNESALLITRNTTDFPAEEPGIRVPYRIQARRCWRRLPATLRHPGKFPHHYPSRPAQTPGDANPLQAQSCISWPLRTGP